MKTKYKLIIKRIGSDDSEKYIYDDLDKALDYYELEVENPTIDRLELIDTDGKIHGSWGKLPRIKLYDHDYVLLRKDEIAESLDVIYHYSSIIDLFNDGFQLNDDEAFVSMTSLSFEQQEKYITHLNNKHNTRTT